MLWDEMLANVRGGDGCRRRRRRCRGRGVMEQNVDFRGREEEADELDVVGVVLLLFSLLFWSDKDDDNDDDDDDEVD